MLRGLRLIALLSVAGGLAATAAQASLPVKRTMTGCVVDGTLISEDGYRIDVRDRDTNQSLDLSRFDDQQVRVSGSLLPGDRFYPNGPIRVLGRCPPGAPRR